MQPSWQPLPPRPAPGTVDPECLPGDDDLTKHFATCFNRPPKLFRKSFRPAPGGGLLIRSSEGWELRMLPWPNPGIHFPDEHRHDLAHDFPYKGCLLPPATVAALAQTDGAEGSTNILADLGLDPEDARALRTFNESFPVAVSEAVFRWRFPDGHYAVAAACAVPGFTTLLDAHPQLAFFTAVHILARSVNEQIRPSAWEPLLGSSPGRIASDVLGLPDTETTLTLLRRLHFDCLAHTVGLHKTLSTAFTRPRAFKTLLTLEAPVSPWVIRLLAAHPEPQPALVRRTNAYYRRDGNDFLAGIILMQYGLLSARLRETNDTDALAGLSRIRSPIRLRREFQRMLKLSKPPERGP